MNKISIKEVGQHVGGQASVVGFVRNKRVHKGVIFVDLRDLSGSVQLVLLESNPAVYEMATSLQLESVIRVQGIVQEKPAKKSADGQVQEKEYEILVEQAELISLSEEQLPIQVLQKDGNEVDIDNRFNWRWLDLRRPENQMIFRTWTELERGFRQYFDQAGYMQIYTPTFMNTASETGADVFEVKYFDRKAYLAQSPQFYKQMAIASGLEKVFMVGSVYRAEKSFTTRHVTEFTGWDFELAYIDSHYDIMVEEENALVAGFKAIKERLPIEIEVPVQPFPRMSLAEAKKKLAAAGIKSEADDDLSPEEERGICEIVKKEFNHDFVFVTDYPVSVRPFYHMRHADNPELTKSFDLLYRGVEITTGAQREHRLEILKAQAIEKGMNLDELSDYLNFFRFGCPNHGGVGIGPARIVMKIMNLPNIKEAIFLPRDVKRLVP